MDDDRSRAYPAIELLAGSIAAVGWVVGLDFTRPMTDTEIVATLTTGLIGAVGAALASLVVRFSSRARRAEMDRLTDDARRDDLTGLVNRPELFRLLDEAIEDARRQDLVLGVLFLDLDRFKMVNDSMGHEAGDELLRIVARRLESTIRSSDVVARLGGDEFVVLCRDLMTADSVVSMARQILRRFDDPVSLGALDHRVGTSIGVAVALPGDGRSADELVRDADAAMYRAKETKSGISIFDDAHRLRIADRLDIERDLRLAIERGELAVHYQPIVDVSSERLYGFEALVRWHHPERGQLSPAEFLPIAGDSGMIGWIGEFVLREACAQAAVWNREAPGAQSVKMSVNLSEPQLADPNLALRVAEVLTWCGLPPEQLVLEITEDVIVDHLDGLDALRHLRALGVDLSIDDFGTGQSSLGYVKDFDMVSILKIDKRFVRDMRSGDADRAIVEAVVSMAAALGMRVVAEGVEFDDQAAELRTIGVQLMQGYLFSRPLRSDDIDPPVLFVDAPFRGVAVDAAVPTVEGPPESIPAPPVGPETVAQMLYRRAISPGAGGRRSR
jgi:diguanylate cyclase (GGDEF)-like protein